jgi:hypothetical protein
MDKAGRSKKTKAQEALLTVRRQFSGSEEVTEQDATIQVREFHTEPARVSIEKGLTLNLGNYESARVTVAVSVPCYLEELEAAYNFADGFVMKKLEEEREGIREMSKAKSNGSSSSSESNPF